MNLGDLYKKNGTISIKNLLEWRRMYRLRATGEKMDTNTIDHPGFRTISAQSEFLTHGKIKRLNYIKRRIYGASYGELIRFAKKLSICFAANPIGENWSVTVYKGDNSWTSERGSFLDAFRAAFYNVMSME